MKLLTVTHFYENHGGGIERVAGRLNRELAGAGHEVAWAASDFDAPPEFPVIAAPLACFDPLEKVSGLPMPIPGPGAIVRLARAVRACDAVIVHDSLYATSIAAALLAKAYRKPLLLIQHISGIAFSNPILRQAMRLANLLVTRPMLRSADQIVFISDVVRRDLLGEPPWRDYALLFNGVDGSIFHRSLSASPKSIRAAHGLPIGVPLAIFVGRFVEKKGLAIVAALARQRPELHVALVGAGPIRPETWGLANVHVIGQQDQAKLAQLYHAADFLLLPSVGEGYPLVVQEAMACGLPVICGEASARADPSASGWLHGVAIDLTDPAGSASRCGAAFQRLIAEGSDGQAIAEYAARAYDWRAMAEAIAAKLSALVQPGHLASGGLETSGEL